MTVTAMPASAVRTPSGEGARGRTRVASKALNRVVTAVTAEALGVDVRHVAVELADHAGALALTVSTPIRVVSLGLVTSDPSAVRRAGGSVLDRTAQAQRVIRERVTTLTGSAIERVTVRISDVDIQPEARVT
ncbi:hypothetical protein [Compostimonas suwonensis]|uniref:Uncharacterized protein n=1 Tax=Compostimonas suwonensis TaxID=1048394 RepID=A0A2M9C0E1_9MICO|nr:hypothetical protein [Compostimonas suwonensis]PJJ63807.1 hypothetical protein CLV54_1483 [Compostimonas suwonensis]